ncbi:MAG: hypothetical protein ABEJ95_05885 [Candidatus Nanohalobium sp.]
MTEALNDEEFSRGERENLHKWGKARKMIDEDRVSIQMRSGDRYQLEVEGEHSEYVVGVDVDTGRTFCPCPFKGDNCSHQIAAHLKLAGIGVEKPEYNR